MQVNRGVPVGVTGDGPIEQKRRLRGKSRVVVVVVVG